MHMGQLFLDFYYFCVDMVAEHVIVIVGLKVEDALNSLEEAQTKIKEIDDQK